MLIDSGVSDMKTNNALLQHSLEAGKQIVEPEISRKAIMKNYRIESLLSRFRPHCLDDLNNAGLMSRVDTKYLLPNNNLKKLLSILSPFYTVLEINFSRIFPYQTTYFDTSEFDFYLMHHNGKQNRFKIRHRLYVDSGAQYVEVKHKTNKRVTQKERILINGNSINREGLNDLISRPFEGNQAQLFKTLVCSYVRIAMADEKNGERLTLDFDLSFNDPDQTRLKQLDQVLIAEVKRSSVKASSRFMDLMDKFQHKPVSFSKYCIGCALLHPEKIKTNRFKATLMALDRISRGRNEPKKFKNDILH